MRCLVAFSLINTGFYCKYVLWIITVHHKRLSLINIYIISLFSLICALRFAFCLNSKKMAIYIYIFSYVVNSFRIRLDKLIATLLTFCIHYIANMSYSETCINMLNRCQRADHLLHTLTSERTGTRTEKLIK